MSHKSELMRVFSGRGFIHQATNLEALDEKASQQIIPAYIGFDCTADSLHVGSLVQIMMLRALQSAGHKPIVLMGGGTTKVGDPSGKDAARPLLSDQDIENNKAGIFSVFEILLASVYTGIARRALDVAVATVGTRRSKKTGLTYSQDPDIRWRIADMALAYDALPPQLETLSRDIDTLVDHGPRWFSLLSGVKHRAVTMAKAVVDDAILVAGGSSYFAGSELSRLYRDVLAGMFHPSDPESAHSTVATAWLGPVG